MLAVKGNKKTRILFYFFIFVFLSTINFFEKTNFFGNKNFFKLKQIEIYGHNKVDQKKMLSELNILIGKNLLFLKIKDIEVLINKNKLVSEYKIIKKYPNKINIKLKEVKFVASLIKNKKKYFLTDNNKLIPFDNSMINKELPDLYGKDAEYHFNDFQKLLISNNFNLDTVVSYYFFQINRWDLIINKEKIIKFPSKNLPEAIKVVNKLLNNKDFDNYSVIDLRINNKVITQ